MKRNKESFQKELDLLKPNSFLVLGEYKNNRTPILIKHILCNKEFYVRPGYILKHLNCPWCSGKKKKNTQDFKEELRQKYGDEYEVLGEYINSKTKIKVLHKKCGTINEVTPNSILRYGGCKKCFHNYMKTTEEFKKQVFDIEKNNYIVLGEYLGNKQKIEMLHKGCGKKYFVTPSRFLAGDRCPYCSPSGIRTEKDIKKEIMTLTGEEYSYIGGYTKSREKFKIRHNVCGNIYDIKIGDFRHGHRCPLCALKGISKKELELFDFTQKHSKEEVCKKKIGKYELDIYIPSKRIGIEFNGTYWHSTEKKEKDYHKEKLSFMIENGIIMYSLWEYWGLETCKQIILEILDNDVNYKRFCIFKNKKKQLYVSKDLCPIKEMIPQIEGYKYEKECFFKKKVKDGSTTFSIYNTGYWKYIKTK